MKFDPDSKQYFKNARSIISKYEKYIFTYWKIIPDVLKALIVKRVGKCFQFTNRFHFTFLEALEKFSCSFKQNNRTESGRYIRCPWYHGSPSKKTN